MRSERGVALLVTVMALLLISAIGAALILTSTSETIIATHFRLGIEARYAAAAVIARGMDDIASLADWGPLTDGSLLSGWVDGPPSGSRPLSDGSAIDLSEVVSLANCQKSAGCSAVDLVAVTADRPWGLYNPRWTPYAYGPLRDLLPAGSAIDSQFYALLLVGNGPSPGRLALRAEAFGPRGAHAVIEVTAGYNVEPDRGALEVLSFREVR